MMDKKVEALKAHPVADIYPMADGDRLARLVELIKTNGLRDPITVGIVGEERWIVDGRNREKACEIAGVMPEYEEIKFKDTAALRAFVEDRNERRDLTIGQRAMAHAMLHPTPDRGGRGKKLSGQSESLGVTKGHWQNLISQARSVKEHSEESARLVMAGTKKLSDAVEEVEQWRQAQSSAEAMMARLKVGAPDLAEMVEDERLKLPEAIAALDRRKKQAEDDRKVATANLCRAVSPLFPRGGDASVHAAKMFDEADPQYWDAPGALDYDTLIACSEVLRIVAEKWRK